jgi:transposase
VLPDLDRLDAVGLKALILAQHAELLTTQERLLSRESEIEHLKLLIAKLRRMQFGRKSEKLDRQIEQLELKLEELESAKACRTGDTVPKVSSDSVPLTKPSRQSLPEHLPREVKTYPPKEEACGECGGRMRRLGEDVSELLEWGAGQLQGAAHCTTQAELRRL